uniref:Protein FAR1-RELATED SEQUENCE n=1 Tax=Oryza rufipogon TaxID=4529 RepID=A0A0E0NHK6_ORYRU
MVEGLPAELPIVDVAARLDGKSSELPENGALLKGAEESQDLGGNPVAELTLHEGKEVILVDDNDSEQEDGGSGKVDENAPRVGLRFKTYDDALKYYKQYAADSGFSAIILKSSYLKSGDELKATMYCDGMPTKVDGQFVTFVVKECSYMEDGKEKEGRNYEVYFCKQELVNCECECGFFQFTGILCRHILSVFKLQEMFEIPIRFVLDRWKRDYKKLHADALCKNDEMLPDVLPDGIIERHDILFTQFRQVLNLGFISEGRYLVALKLLRQAEKTLLDDGDRGRQAGLLSFEAEAPENDEGIFSPEFSEGVKNSQSTNAKRRGRPTKKLIESDSDTVLRPNKEQDFLRSSFVTDESNMIQGAPSASHLESPHLGVDLMAQADSQGYGNQWAFPTLQVFLQMYIYKEMTYMAIFQDNSMLRTAARRGV